MIGKLCDYIAQSRIFSAFYLCLVEAFVISDDAFDPIR